MVFKGSSSALNQGKINTMAGAIDRVNIKISLVPI
jgi:hypothetical protein